MVSKPTLEELYELNTWRSEIAGWFIVVGLGVELVSLIVAGRPLSETVPQAIADTLIAGGVAFELLFARKARAAGDSIQTQAKLETARANERAATLEKEAADARGRVADIERATAGRHLSEEQCQQAADSIRFMAADIDLLIEYERGDGEAFTYANEIWEIFRRAGVPKVAGDANSWFSPTSFGLFAAATDVINLSYIQEAFAKSGMILQPKAIDFSNQGKHVRATVTGGPNLYIFVAPKPPPILRSRDAESADDAAPQRTTTSTRE